MRGENILMIIIVGKSLSSSKREVSAAFRGESQEVHLRHTTSSSPQNSDDVGTSFIGQNFLCQEARGETGCSIFRCSEIADRAHAT